MFKNNYLPQPNLSIVLHRGMRDNRIYGMLAEYD